MLRIKLISLIVLIACCISFAPAYSAEPKEVESITILADSRLAVSLSQLSSAFSSTSMISVSNVFGDSVAQVKKIEDGDSADLFITADPALIEQLKIKGLIDVYSVTQIITIGPNHFTAVVVASENMTPARSFLTYLKSPEAKTVFKRNS